MTLNNNPGELSRPAPIGVLLLAYGGPNSLDELPGYLADIRSGRPTTSAVLKEMTHNYTLIGGKSPLLEMCRRQGAALQKLLNSTEPPATSHQPLAPNSVPSSSLILHPSSFKVYLGMRHWSPWTEEVVRDMISDGIQKAVAIVLAPQYSRFTTDKYFEKVKAGLEMFGGNIDFEYVNSYNTAPKYIQALVNRVREGLERWPEAERDSVHVILSAHSLPVRVIKMGDPYQDQLFETARLVVAGAGLRDDRWSWAYQSAGRSPEPWLGPQIEAFIPELAAKGVRNIVSVPIGFVSDHVEMLFDIDIKAQAVARQLGVRLERPPALNTDPLYIETLADLVWERSTRWLPQAVGA